jgi:hypothetical protein
MRPLVVIIFRSLRKHFLILLGYSHVLTKIRDGGDSIPLIFEILSTAIVVADGGNHWWVML